MGISRVRTALSLASLLGASSVLAVCSSLPPTGGSLPAAGDRPVLLTRRAPASSEPLVFPPVDTSRHARPPLPEERAESAPEKDEPEAEPKVEKAPPKAVIAGKELSYVPEPGRFRIVATHPSTEQTISRHPVFSVLYDQAIDLARARNLIRLSDQGGKNLPFVVAHPSSSSFQGVKVDARYVVLVRPSLPLAHDAKIWFRAEEPGGQESRAWESSYFVSPKPELNSVRCGYGDEDGCSFKDGVLFGASRRVILGFTNRIVESGKALEARVHVSPPVKNLSVYNYSWSEGEIQLEASFAPSTTYTITLTDLSDRFGNKLSSPVRFKLVKAPESASVSMPEGLVLLDEENTKRFSLTSRNVAEAEILAFSVDKSAGAFGRALDEMRGRELPKGDPTARIPVSIKAERDRMVTTAVDLSSKLVAGQSYLATLRPTKMAFGAVPMRFPERSEAAKPMVALLRPFSPTALALHARTVGKETLVHVARLATGEPVAGAQIQWFGDKEKRIVASDAQGLALLPGAPPEKPLLEVHAADAELFLPASGGTEAEELFPHLSRGAEGAPSDLRAMVMSDRGIYRPGSRIWVKASVRKPEGDRLAAVAGKSLRLRLVGPTGDELVRETRAANDMGSVDAHFDLPAQAKLGRYQLLVEDPASENSPLGSSVVQVAEFEPPRFAVDVETRLAAPGKLREAPRIEALIHGRYLFGAPMDGANVSWTLSRKPAPMPAGALTDELVFRSRSAWYEDDDDDESSQDFRRTGEATLAADGTLRLTQAAPLDPSLGPQAFTIEADVSDSSYRHIAGRAGVVLHPSSRYAGLKLAKRWVGVGERVAVELGVIDTEGQAVRGARVSAKLERVVWSYAQHRGPGGSLRWEWSSKRTRAGSCEVTSASAPVSCSLLVPSSGSYEVVAEVDGKRGGAISFWAYREGDSSIAPQRRSTLELVTDKARYAPGDRAKILVQSPFRSATAILTLEQGRLVSKRAMPVEGSAAVFEVPIEAAHAPEVVATVTLVPKGDKDEAKKDARIGAVALPVALGSSRLSLAVASNKLAYEPGEEAEITLDVRDGETPEAHAEIALAVVDEGVLRLTNHHAPDPVSALRPRRALSFEMHDSRKSLAELLEQSHTAGDGGGEGSATIGRARKNFVETAFFKPDLRTDAAGRATARFKLPDNLSEFRIMAVALDDEGKGAVVERGFVVRKSVMAVPIVPRFALVGDHFEAAVMVHNNASQALEGVVRMGDQKKRVRVAAGSKERVGFALEATKRGSMRLDMSVEEGGRTLDRVEAKVRVSAPGVEERPRLSGSFLGAQTIALELPAEIDANEDDTIAIQVGQHLFPELGARLGYLLDYPHGCVEQTTSSTLPLLAARTILPRIGASIMSDEALVTRIKAGLLRLASMRTDEGGLAYWPGGHEPNVYGTAYAIRALVLARGAKIPLPEGLLEGMMSYLHDRLLSENTEAEVAAAIAQSLSELGELPEGAVDALVDRSDAMSVFGKASLALALSRLKGQEDRVSALLDAIEKSFDPSGKLLMPAMSDDFYYYGSERRSKAQAAIALARLRRSALVLPTLLEELSRETEGYTTQATAYSLLALAEELSADPGEGAKVVVTLDGKPLTPKRDLGHGSVEIELPVAELRGRKATLKLASDGKEALGFSVAARWRRPLAGASSLAASATDMSPSLYRVFTSIKGEPVDLEKITAGEILRVALRVRLPSDHVTRARLGYVAVTDHLPAGFEPIQPDLATVASAPEISDAHPFARLMRWSDERASHVEMHDDRVDLYFDRVWDDELFATYLVRATTPGSFALPPATAELMYEPNSLGYAEAGRVVVQ